MQFLRELCKAFQKRLSTPYAVKSGMALPSALFLVMVISVSGAMFSKASIQNLKIVTLQEGTSDTFQVAEGAIHDIVRLMSVRPHLWREQVPVAGTPNGYTEYSPLAYVATNNIPSCLGPKCLLDLYPTGGGLIKNFGPSGGDGDAVDTSRHVYDQLNTSSPPTRDVTLNGQSGWSQVERMDEKLPDGSSMGADLSNNPLGGGSASNIRFRITGKTLRTIHGRQGESTVVVIAEIPAA